MNRTKQKRAEEAGVLGADDLTEEQAQAIWDGLDDEQRGELVDYHLPGQRQLLLKCLTRALFEVKPEDTVKSVFVLAGRKCRGELERRGSPLRTALEAE